MSRTAKAALILASGAYSGSLFLLGHARVPTNAWDTQQLYLAGRALLSGGEPYRAVLQQWPYPLFYPLPAVLLWVPLGLLPPLAARIIWAGLQGSALAYAGLRRPPLFVALLSPMFLHAVLLGQWSPLVAAAAVVPAIGVCYAAKPNIGLEVMLGFPNSRAVAWSLGLVLASLIILPGWPREWVGAVRGQIYLPAVMRPWGFVLLLSALEWRRPEGRLMAALALIPQSTAFYETVLLFLVATSVWEAVILAALGFVAVALWKSTGAIEIDAAVNWPVTLGCLYIPALLLVLRPRLASLVRQCPPAGMRGRRFRGGSGA